MQTIPAHRLRQPFAVDVSAATEVPAAVQHDLGGSADALAFIPAFDFAPDGSLAVTFNGQESDRKKSTCPTNVFPGAERIFPKMG